MNERNRREDWEEEERGRIEEGKEIDQRRKKRRGDRTQERRV